MISAIVLGAGLSRRMGNTNKLLLKINEKPIVEMVLDAVVKSDVEEIVLVYKDKEVCDIGLRYGAKCIYNNISYQGQSTSVIKGINAASDLADGYMFIPADIPYLDTNCINLVINTFYNDKTRIVIPTYNGVKGNPVIFPRKLRKEFDIITGDTGGKTVINMYPNLVTKVEMGDSYTCLDIDSMEDYLNVIGGYKNDK